MEPNAISVLQQLSSNPQLVNQLQSLLTVLSHGEQDDGPVGMPSPSLAAVVSSPGHKSQQNQSMSAAARRGSAHMSSTGRSVHHGEVNSSQVSYRTAETMASEGVSLQRYEKLMGRCRQLEEELEEKTREASDATQRMAQLERETTHLMRRVEQLTNTVEVQKHKLDKVEGMHKLELAEVENRHELDLRAKLASHEEAMRRLMEAQQLMVAAKQYEQTVNGITAAGRQTSDTVSTTTPANKRSGITSSRPGSSVKQPLQLRQTTDDGSSKRETDTEEKAEFLHYGSSSAKRKRDNTNGVSPATQNKKRTPRTPSLTAADRVVPTTGTKNASQSVKVEHDSPHLRAGNAAAFIEDRYLTKARNPSSTTVSPGPATSTITEAMARHHHHQQQTQQTQRDGVHNVESRFITQYGAAVLPPAPPLPPPPAPLSVPTSTKTSLVAPSRTPRKRGLNNSDLQQRWRSGQRSGTSSVVGGPTRSPSPVNPKRGAEQPRCFVVTSLTEEERARVKAAVAAIGQNGIMVESDYEDPPPFTATHIVVRGPPRSMKALCGVVGSKWLVQPEYIYASRDAGFWLDEYEEGGLRCFPPPLKCQRFLLTMPDGIVKEKLEQVIEYGGGEVVRPARDGRSYDQGVIVIASGDDLLRFATRIE